MKTIKKDTQACPCGSTNNYKACCQNYVEQTSDAPTAETLMRARYTAFVLSDEGYLRYSWHPETCPKNIRLNNNTKWLGLEIKNTKKGGMADETGEVVFVARSKIAGKAHRLHERSRFMRINNRWYYIDGDYSDK